MLMNLKKLEEVNILCVKTKLLRLDYHSWMIIAGMRGC